jgi:3-deoxy-7-phosphoheptulonate synthase
MKDITERDRHTNLRLAVKQYEGHRTKVRVGSAEFGGDQPVIIAGPCAVESRPQILAIAEAVKRAGASMLRGGAFKPLTFPYRNERVFELRERGLEYLQEAGRHADLPVVSEVVDVRLVETVARHVDMIQIGSRNMQNFPLLEEAARTGKPVLLKRHYGSSLRDWLGAAEYLLYHGNPNVVLCERGVVAPHTHQPASRFIVDLQVVPAVRDCSHLPVIVDPSHATFRREYVAPIARAALAVGADGVMVDVHPVPEEAAVDPLQALNYEAFGRLVEELRAIASAMAHASPVGHS